MNAIEINVSVYTTIVLFAAVFESIECVVFVYAVLVRQQSCFGVSPPSAPPRWHWHVLNNNPLSRLHSVYNK